MALQLIDTLASVENKYIEDIILNIIQLIKSNKDVVRAAQLVIDNNLSLNEIIKATSRLSVNDLVSLTDSILLLKGRN